MTRLLDKVTSTAPGVDAICDAFEAAIAVLLGCDRDLAHDVASYSIGNPPNHLGHRR
jgi:hypothetical protein